MSSHIEVRIGMRGSVKGGIASANPSQIAHCDLCNLDVDAVASTSRDGGGPFACKACLRIRLEAMTVGAWLLRDEHGSLSPSTGAGLPWGKVSG